MMNNKAQSQETFAQRSAINEHFAELGELTLVPSLTTIDDYTVKPIDCK